MSRQENIGELSPWFNRRLDDLIESKYFISHNQILGAIDKIVAELQAYSRINNINNVVIGMSGGVDSALTAYLFKRASWNVFGVALPINQNQEETDRALETIQDLKIDGSVIDLSSAYEDVLRATSKYDKDIYFDNHQSKIRRGNLRARLRMMTLYNIASSVGGLVASTDNFSELMAGFWTLHGDVGDLAPIQMLNKSWEVPMMARIIGVGKNTWKATPTDGLGISAGDEAQLGCSYLEWDIIVETIRSYRYIDNIRQSMQDDPHALNVLYAVTSRINKTRFKRNNPFNITSGNNREYTIQQIDAICQGDV